RPDRADRSNERVLVDRAERGRKQRLELRIEPPPEAAAAADEVLPRAALRFVDRTRGAAAERRALELVRDVELVHPVPELVHRQEQRRQFARARVRRQPEVTGARLRRERVRGLVDPPAVRVVAERLEHAAAGLLLLLDREGALERGAVVGATRDQRDEHLL